MYLRCTAVEHLGERVLYSILDVTGEAEKALKSGRCPMCPEQSIPTAPDALPVCPCCVSTWMTSDESASCLPGSRTEMTR